MQLEKKKGAATKKHSLPHFWRKAVLFFFLHRAAAISGDDNEVSVEAGQEASALA